MLEFAVYSFIGWLYETILTSAVIGKFADRGYLHLPFCPIYGVFAMILLMIFRKRHDIARVFIMTCAVSAVLELICSYIIEAVLHCRLWDYSGWPMDLDGRISLPSSLIFGIMGVLLVNLLHPMMQKSADRFPRSVLTIVSAVFVTAVSADFTVCILIDASTLHIV